MKTQRIKKYCQEKDCEEFAFIDWDGKFIEKWYCKKHAYMRMLLPKKKNKYYNEAGIREK